MPRKKRASEEPVSPSAPARASERPAVVLSYEAARYRLALPLLVRRTMAFSARPEFDPLLVRAVKDFYGMDMDVPTAETEILEDEDERTRFFPWFLWDWREGAGAPTLGERYADSEPHAPHERRLLEALARSYVGFYEALEDADERGALVREMASGEILRIVDDGLGGDLSRGEVLQARLVRVAAVAGVHDAVDLIDTVYAVLPPEAKPAVEAEIASLPRDLSRELARWHAAAYEACTSELLERTESLLEVLAAPPSPLNADGERMVLCRASFGGADVPRVLGAIDRLVARGVLHEVDPVASPGLYVWRAERPSASSPLRTLLPSPFLAASPIFAPSPILPPTPPLAPARLPAPSSPPPAPGWTPRRLVWVASAAGGGQPRDRAVPVPAAGAVRVELGATSPRRLDALVRVVSRHAKVPPPRLRSYADFAAAAAEWTAGSGRDDVWLRWSHALPDVADATRRWLSTWALSWIDMPQEALGDLSPREAVRWSDGRRQVARILSRIERLRDVPPGVPHLADLAPDLESDLALLRSELRI